MSEDTKQLKRARVRFGRQLGASPETRARLSEANAGLEWFARCPRCKTMLKGTLTEVGDHDCGAPR